MVTTDRSEIDAATGLTAAQVRQRIETGQVNHVPAAPSRTISQILRANILTRFNLLMLALLAVVLACRAWKDALFGGVIVANAAVGIVQELRAKWTLDKLAVLSAPKAVVVRDGEISDIAINDIVMDDIVDLRSGLQVVADAIVVTADGLEVDESLLTGESDPVVKQVGDELMSGSFVVAGSGRARVDKVGADAYAAKLAEEARRFTLSTSELRQSIDRIVTWVGWAIVPTGAVLFWSQLRTTNDSVQRALVSATGGVVAMVPEGLILLTSVAFAVGVVRLARQRTLVQELPAIETLARVDVICLDKTGTITSGEMSLADIDYLDLAGGDGAAGADRATIEGALAAISWSDPNPNPTQAALRTGFEQPTSEWAPSATIAFSSSRKWMAMSFDGRGSWVFGAPEMVLEGAAWDAVSARVNEEARSGRRVLALGHSDAALSGEELPAGLQCAALVMIEDTIRDDAEETLAFFDEQGVVIKVISGDNPITVAAVAQRAGVPDAENVADARDLPEGDLDALATVVEATTVFGRVKPHQKREMVAALQSRGHVVAMTGDGVNDVLALKDADVGIAMASGSEATRAVAQLVLLDSNFSGLPKVVDEGRRVINNLVRVASLFLTKTTYAVLIAIITGIAGIRYPFLPRQLTMIGTLTIGLPSFFLALAPNTDRVEGDFFAKVARIAVPSGIVIAAATMISYLFAQSVAHVSIPQEQTTATLTLTGIALLVLARTSRPFVPWKAALVIAMGVLVMASILTPMGRDYFELTLPPAEIMWVIVGMVAGGAWLLVLAELGIRRRWPK